MKKVYGKLGNMRKSVDWTVYPHKDGETTIFVQSDKRAVSIDLTTGKGMLSNGKGHPSFMSVLKVLGAVEIDVPQDFIDACLEAQPKSGDRIGPGIFIG